MPLQTFHFESRDGWKIIYLFLFENISLKIVFEFFEMVTVEEKVACVLCLMSHRQEMTKMKNVERANVRRRF